MTSDPDRDQHGPADRTPQGEGDATERPWGSYQTIDEQASHKVKRIVVSPGRRISYQRHAHRAEHWFVVSGAGQVTLDGADRHVGAGDAVDVPQGSAHRIAADDGAPLVFIEVQTGSYFGEDDIERLDDDYGRS